MTSHLSERFHDHERDEVYRELIQSCLDRPPGEDQNWLLDRVATTVPRPRLARQTLPRLSVRWLALPRLPLPFLTWAQS